MKKIPTLFRKDPNDLGRVIKSDPLFPIEELQFRIKLDGTSCYLISNIPYVRYDAKLIKRKRGKVVQILSKEEVMLTLPPKAIPCQEPDENSGHWPHWIPLLFKPEYQYHIEGYENSNPTHLGSYECIGPSINNNPHKEDKHMWVYHQSDSLLVQPNLSKDYCYEQLKEFLKDFPWEGLVAYRDNIPVSKIRRSDYGYEYIQYKRVSDLLG